MTSVEIVVGAGFRFTVMQCPIRYIVPAQPFTLGCTWPYESAKPSANGLQGAIGGWRKDEGEIEGGDDCGNAASFTPIYHDGLRLAYLCVLSAKLQPKAGSTCTYKGVEVFNFPAPHGLGAEDFLD